MADATQVEARRPVRVRVTSSSGSICIVAEPRADVLVEGRASIEVGTDGDTSVKASSKAIEVWCPEGADVVAGTSSGDVRLHGRFGEVRITTSSARIEIDHATAAELRTSSGSVRMSTCDGVCRVATSSGNVEVDRAGELDVRTSSGKIDAGAASASVRSVSAKVLLRLGDGDAAVETVSGSVTLVIPALRRPSIQVRGQREPRIEVEQGSDGLLRVGTVSGRLTVRPE